MRKKAKFFCGPSFSISRSAGWQDAEPHKICVNGGNWDQTACDWGFACVFRSGRADLLRRIDDGPDRRLRSAIEEGVVGALHPLEQTALRIGSNICQLRIIGAVVSFFRIEAKIVEFDGRRFDIQPTARSLSGFKKSENVPK